MRLWLFIAVGLIASTADASQIAKIEINGDSRTLIHREIITCHIGKTGVTRKEYPRDVIEHAPVGGALVVEYCAADAETMDEVLLREGVGLSVVDTEEVRDEVVTIVDSGPAENRIDLVFIGDGYTVDERDKFFADMRRLVDDMFVGATFRSQLPLFNIHLVFRASAESGIGRDRPRDTAYRLYRQGNTLRAIYMQDRWAARASCRAAPGCDYPVVIANDPYYGGLGGEFAIVETAQKQASCDGLPVENS